MSLEWRVRLSQFVTTFMKYSQKINVKGLIRQIWRYIYEVVLEIGFIIICCIFISLEPGHSWQ